MNKYIYMFLKHLFTPVWYKFIVYLLTCSIYYKFDSLLYILFNYDEKKNWCWMYFYSTLLQSIILFHIRYKELYFLVKTRSNNVKGTFMYTWFELEIFKFVFRGGHYYWFIKIWISVIELRLRCFVKKKKSSSHICVALV